METCPKCGEAMDLTDKDTSSGREIREYKCRHCGYSDWEDRGIALWQALSDAREQTEAAAAERATSAAGPKPPATAVSPWQRLLAIFRPPK
jgi:DNA-directed RNA polymerase subunit M/transcription elongation factor TFIIS